MKWRVIFLIIIILFRFSLGWFKSSRFEQYSEIGVSGNIDKIYQYNSKCIIIVGRFWSDSRENCAFSRNSRVRVVGRVRSRVIDRFLGRIWLDSVKLSVLEKAEDRYFFSWFSLAIFRSMRENIVDIYRKYLPIPESGLVAGIVLGYKKDIGRDFYDQMVRSGTVHIAVASGYNIMLVGGTVLSVCFWFLRRKWASIVGVLMMLLYALEAGGEPPVIRAVIMASVVYLSFVVGRRATSWWTLLVTGWMMILIEPLLLVDVSFQLSMAASVGLMIVDPFLSRVVCRNGGEKLTTVLGGTGVITSVATMVVTAPVIWWHFGRMSMIGILSNILILPFVPILMVFGAAMQVLPAVFYLPTYVIAHWMVGVIRFFGS